MRKLIMGLGFVLIGLALILGLGATNQVDAQARHEDSRRPCSSIGIVTDYLDNSLHILEPETNTLSGPYLKGALGEGNSLLRTAVTPDGKTALIINYNSYAIFFVELPHQFGQPPILSNSIDIGYNAEDAAITPDGKYALVSYGGNEAFIAVVDIDNRSLITTYEPAPLMKAPVIRIAADGQTVLGVDGTNNKIHVMILSADGNLTHSHSIDLTFQPHGISLSPDGITTVAANPATGSPAILRIDSPGNVKLEEENILLQFSNGVSAVFSNNGTKFYYLSNNGRETYINLLDVPAPGVLLPTGTRINIYPGKANGETPGGFDSMEIDPSGDYAYVWRKTLSVGNPSGISVIDLEIGRQIKHLEGVKFPAGITFACVESSPDKADWTDNPPFGSFETPADGSTVRSSIAVTGWALDDIAVESVKIYRMQGSTPVYIGDATFTEGARPDVANAYSTYPSNTWAGWGYMLLSNFLPNQGNGTFHIRAVARDCRGNTTILGTKTIYCKNASATKPFGALDTPQPGEVISGKNYRVQGWALTPQPNKIPENGSTIKVLIDGKVVGHAAYNIARSDIANLFPGYANSERSLLRYNLDTTQYSEGMHTISLQVTDSAGNTDGIGSRYFTTANDTSFTNLERLRGYKISGDNVTFVFDWEAYNLTGSPTWGVSLRGEFTNWNWGGWAPHFKLNRNANDLWTLTLQKSTVLNKQFQFVVVNDKMTPPSDVPPEYLTQNDRGETVLKVETQHTLISTRWNVYTWPYNAYYPPAPDGINGHVGNACGPTALAKILKYWEHPLKGNGSFGFTDKRGHYWSANFEGTWYKWENMPNYLPPDSKEEEYGAVATLMYHCAVAMNDHYCTGKSCNYLRGVLVNIFNYSNSAQVIFRDDYTAEQWDAIFKNELDNQRPILLSGHTIDGPAYGHYFICDGYNDNGEYHVLWNMSGSQGYYPLDEFGKYRFNNYAIIGIKKNNSVPISLVFSELEKSRGYRIGGGDIVFVFDTDVYDLSADSTYKIDLIGDFTDWQSDDEWEMIRCTPKLWILTVPKTTALNKEFKFIVNYNMKISPLPGVIFSDLEKLRGYKIDGNHVTFVFDWELYNLNKSPTWGVFVRGEFTGWMWGGSYAPDYVMERTMGGLWILTVPKSNVINKQFQFVVENDKMEPPPGVPSLYVRTNIHGQKVLIVL